MSIFSRKDKTPEPSRRDRLADNGGQPFSTVLSTRKDGEKLDRYYENDSCLVIGNPDGLETGAVLQVRRDGVLATLLGKDVAQLESASHRQRVNDFFDNSHLYTSVEARLVSVEDSHLYCNLGFYVRAE